MSNKFWIGCDISKSTFWIALAKVDNSGTDWTKLPYHEFEHTAQGMAAFLHWLEGQGLGEEEVAGICLESTGRLSLKWATRFRSEPPPCSSAAANMFAGSFALTQSASYFVSDRFCAQRTIVASSRIGSSRKS